MKQKFTKTIAAVCLVAGIMMHPFASSAAGKENGDPVEKTTDKKDTKKTKVSTSRNNSSVRIYPDVLKRVMHVVAKDNEGADIDFFVFDTEGTLVKHYKMKSGGHEKITDLERGKYVFRVFSGDDETAAGNMDIR